MDRARHEEKEDTEPSIKITTMMYIYILLISRRESLLERLKEHLFDSTRERQFRLETERKSARKEKREKGTGFEHLFVILRCRGVAKADAVG